jgi:hypothetical protein
MQKCIMMASSSHSFRFRTVAGVVAAVRRRWQPVYLQCGLCRRQPIGVMCTYRGSQRSWYTLSYKFDLFGLCTVSGAFSISSYQTSFKALKVFLGGTEGLLQGTEGLDRPLVVVF